MDDATIDAINTAAGRFVDVVHGGGSRQDIVTITRKMKREHLIGLAVAIAAMVPTGDEAPEVEDPSEGWSEIDLRAAHAAYGAGDRRRRVAKGEQIYQRLRYLRRTGRLDEPSSA